MPSNPQWKAADKSVVIATYGAVYGPAYPLALRPDGKTTISGKVYEVGRTSDGQQYMRSLLTGKTYVFDNGALLTHAVGTGNIDVA